MWAWILLLLSVVAFIVFVALTVIAAIRQSGDVKTFGIGMAASIVVVCNRWPCDAFRKDAGTGLSIYPRG